MVNTLFLYIHWNPDPTAFRLGSLAIHWYSLCWIIGLTLGYFIVKHLYTRQKIKSELFEPLFLYMFLGVLIGARLGHCLFYEPAHYLSSVGNFIEMLLPISIGDDGHWSFTGYRGLASHGGVLGMLVAFWLYSRHTHVSIWVVLDNVGIAAPVTATFIRLGNLMNSEIIGNVTDVPWAFIFERVDMLPRHPGQLYEAMFYALFFFVGWFVYMKKSEKVGTGFFFGLCLTAIFTFRFFIEFTKDIQVSFEAGMPLDMGQLLSIPLVALGVCCMVGGKWMRKIDVK